MTPPTKQHSAHGGDGNDDRSPDTAPPPCRGRQHPASEEPGQGAAQRDADRADRQ